jgi:hypothetical protein
LGLKVLKELIQVLKVQQERQEHKVLKEHKVPQGL